ncbi:MAG: hypothetical protein ACTSXC_05835 [Candidatus Freyarchaeota archaeon]
MSVIDKIVKELEEKAFNVTCLCRDGYGQWNRTLAYGVVKLEDVKAILKKYEKEIREVSAHDRRSKDKI